MIHHVPQLDAKFVGQQFGAYPLSLEELFPWKQLPAGNGVDKSADAEPKHQSCICKTKTIS